MCVVVVVSRIESMRIVVSGFTGAGAGAGTDGVVSSTGAASDSSSLFLHAVSAALSANPAINKRFMFLRPSVLEAHATRGMNPRCGPRKSGVGVRFRREMGHMAHGLGGPGGMLVAPFRFKRTGN